MSLWRTGWVVREMHIVFEDKAWSAERLIVTYLPGHESILEAIVHSDN